MSEEQEISEDVEPWIAQTQASLGACIARPRLLTERLRKPPFRFLFDIAVEVSRQTGFGVAELFGASEAGHIPEKPTAPSAREEKVDFLQRWISVTAAALPSHAEALAEVSVVDVLRGLQPERTNYFLQCLCAAAWQQPEEPTQPSGENWPDADAAPPEAPAVCIVEPQPAEISEVPEVRAAREAAEKAAAQTKAAQEEWARIQAAREERAQAGADAEVNEREMTAALAELGNLQEEFERTARSFRSNAGQTEEDDSDDLEEDPPPPPLPGQLDDQDPDPRSPSTGMFLEAKDRANKANDELARAQNLIANIEDALDAKDTELQQKKDLEVQKREAMAAAADAKVRAEQAEEEKRQLEKAAKKAKRKAEKQAEKERLQREAEERAASQKHSAMYPVSKTSQAQGGRLVSCVGAGEEEEYERDWDEEEAPEAPEAPEPPRADGMDACFSDAILGQVDDLGAPSSVQKEELFEQIKAETRETFVSYLCASLPSALLKKYPAEQLVGCLQTLMQELRNCVLQQGLEDVLEEEPTSVAEELRQGSRDGWLDYLQSMNPHALRQRFDLTELIDTFQALCQTCFDRLTDELGPMSRWVHRDSLLYVSPPAPPSLPPPKHEDVESHPRVREIEMRESPTAIPPPAERKDWPERLATAPASRSAAPRTDLPPKAGPVFDATLGPALWEMPGPGTSPSLPLPSTGRLGTGRLGSNLPLQPGTTQVTRPLLSR